ncbi:Hypothetical_protein [Hexamita inflata]|uniref:Hypothetical_protein n=1 Tax=Hexamita inflata TaxID=28002 RepID=A0AA86Q2A5_9EUKA|nr:Hypothetical protein HINF_LOCUS37633 [Hexamita inflata]CAI9949991.1 Hypothetical protein HINF_LOCUS37636 [Hexamita inflata]
MYKTLMWNNLQFVANPGLVSIVLYRVILQLNSVVRPDSTEETNPNQSTVFHFATPALVEFLIYSGMLYFLPLYLFQSILLNLSFEPDIQFFSGFFHQVKYKNEDLDNFGFFHPRFFHFIRVCE